MSGYVLAILVFSYLSFDISNQISDDLPDFSWTLLQAYAPAPCYPSRIYHGRCNCSSFCFGEAFRTYESGVDGESSEIEHRGASSAFHSYRYVLGVALST